MAKTRSRRTAKSLNSRKRPADTSSVSLAGGTDLAELRRLIRLVQRTGIGELEVSSGGRSVRISASPGSVLHAPVVATDSRPAAGSETADESGTTATKPSNTIAITSPMVGTFYRAPAPDADPYVDVGDMVETGQTVCIVEAMKLMNEIESEVRGRIVQIPVENAQPVEFGQTLFLVDPV